MLPFTTTKIGPGDKTKAYVVRQNVCLKILLFSFTFAIAMVIVLSTTLYEVHIERRTSARNAGVHRREEHALRMQVGRLGMRLQQHMKDDMRDMSILREYRARMYRAVGEYQNAVRLVVEDATGRNATLSSELTRLELELDEQLERSMKQLWSDVNEEGKRASDVLRNLTSEIIDGFKHDAREKAEFENTYGEGTDYHEDAEHGLRRGEEGDPLDDGDDDDDDDEDDENYEEMRMKFALERLHSRLVSMPNITLEADELQAWEGMYTAALDAMGDEGKEADLEAIQTKLSLKLEAHGVLAKSAPSTGGSKDAPDATDEFDDDYTPSVFDQFEQALEAAKMTPHKQDLFDKYAQWAKGDMGTMDLVQHIEELYDQRVLDTGLFDDWDD